MSVIFDPVAVVGAGAWGTALANAAARAGRRVTLWTRDPDHASEMAALRQNARRLPGIDLESVVTPTAAAAPLAAARLILLVTPTQTIREMTDFLAGVMRPGVPIVSCAKGIDRATGLFPTEIIADGLRGRPVATLSGPSFAQDVSRGLPTAVTLACADEVIAAALAQALSGPAFRLYHSTDVRGAELGGAAKNVLAIAAGIVAGRGLGDSARAALIARGFAELMRLAAACGGRPETLMGLSGLGDIILTCGSDKSRNFAFGHAIGQGLPPERAAAGKLAEGAFTAQALVELARARGVDMPICEGVAALITGQMTVDDLIEGLLSRPLKSEI